MISKQEREESFSPPVLEMVDLPEDFFGPKIQGKVRDIWRHDGQLIMVTTDRQSAYDKVVCLTPGKGRQLNMLSQFWFEKTADIVPNHMIAVPHPNVMICKECELIPLEMVVRAYITGSTDTSLWVDYSQGKGRYRYLELPKGLKKNQKLENLVCTPTTKAPEGQHDVAIKPVEAASQFGEMYWEMGKVARALFERGSQIYQKAGLILVDTKFEFGLDRDKRLTLIDELFTPDSSRIWLAETYEEKFSRGEEPDGLDKEFLRLWLRDQGFTGDGPVPQVPSEITNRLATLYAEPYKRLTGKDLSGVDSSPEAIKMAILDYL